MTHSPASILYDASGNPVGVVLDGAIYRLQVEAKVAGTVAVTDNGGSLTIDNANLDAPLSGVATEATLAALESKAATEATVQTLATEATAQTLLTQSEFQARVGTLGQKPMTGSTPVVLASDQSRVLVEAVIADAGGTPSTLITRGGITRQAIDNPELMELMADMLDQLKAIRAHLEIITEEGVEDDHH